MGRITDGAAEWILFTNPTPGSTNGSLGMEEALKLPFNIYPNPSVIGSICISRTGRYAVYDLSGREVIPEALTREINTSHLKPGLYLLRESGGGAAWLILQ